MMCEYKVFLFFSDAPVFLVNHSNSILVHSGDNVSLSCEADGNPPPEYQWTVDDGVDLLGNSSELGVQVNSNATYSCTAINNFGKTTLSIQVYMPPVTGTLLAAAPGPEPPCTCSCLLSKNFLIAYLPCTRSVM